MVAAFVETRAALHVLRSERKLSGYSRIRAEGAPAEPGAPRAQPQVPVAAPQHPEADSLVIDDPSRRTRPPRRKQLSQAISLIDKMAGKGIIHRNTASRYKSRLSARRLSRLEFQFGSCSVLVLPTNREPEPNQPPQSSTTSRSSSPRIAS